MGRRWLLPISLWVLVLSAAGFAAGPLEAEQALKGLEVADGLEATLFASEPMLCNPTDIDIDARGRVWVAEGINYRKWKDLDPAGDRIVILEDTNGDGKADTSKVFYQGKDIDSALGICILGNKVLVSRSPNVFVFTDADGDDVADKKEVLFTGIEGEQNDHGVHAFVFGPDGKLYFNAGNASQQIRHPDGTPVKDLTGNIVNTASSTYRQGWVFRCNPDGSDFETLAWNFRNNYEVAVDSFGTLWQSDNDDDGNKGVRINYVMEFGNYGYKDEMNGDGWREERTNIEEEVPLRHWHLNDPGVVPNLLQTGAGSPTGILVYEGALLPQVFWNQIIHCDAGPNVVRAYPVTQDGAGYKATTVNLLYSPSDTWFRPSDVCAGPDGSVYVADWYDPGVGGNNMGDNAPGHMRGRIYRVAPPGNKPFVPKMDLRSAKGCAGALASPNLSARYSAWTGLHEMGIKAEHELAKVWRGSDPRMRARALQLLARIEGRSGHWLDLAVTDKNPDIRITGLRIVRELKVDVIPYVRKLAKDPSPQVRRECAIALRYNPSPLAPALWAALAQRHDGRDRWYLEALGIGADGQENAFFSAWLAQVGRNWNTPAGRDIIWRSRGDEVPVWLEKIIADEATDTTATLRYIRALWFQPKAPRNVVLTRLLDRAESPPSQVEKWNRIALEAVTRFPDFEYDPGKVSPALVERMADTARGSAQLVQMIKQFNLTDRDSDLLDYVLTISDKSDQVEALRLFVDGRGDKILRERLGGTDFPHAGMLAELLGFVDQDSVRQLLMENALETSRDGSVRLAAVTGLAHTKSGASRLIAMAKEGNLPAELKGRAAQSLHSAPKHWKEIREEAAAVLPPPVAIDGSPLPPLEELLELPAEAPRGAKVFENICAKCHQVGGIGTEFGPNLSEIGGKLGKDALVTSILEPSAGISFGYEGVMLTLTDGSEKTGYILSENEKEVTLREAEGIATAYPKDEIEERTRLTLSLMPEDLEKGMSAQDLADLLEFLASLKPHP